MIVPPAASPLRVLTERKIITRGSDFDPAGDLVQLQPMQDTVAAAWRSKGRDPTILPAWMLEAPMWMDPSTAARDMSMRRVYTGRYLKDKDDSDDAGKVASAPLAIEIHNPVGRIGQLGGVGSPHGLLRYSDLDVVIAVMQQCMGNRNRAIEYETGRLLDWLGKDPEEFRSAYRALRGSIMRLTTTQIVIYLDGTETHLETEDMPAPFSILVNDGRAQERGVIRGKISDYVAENLANGDLWQMIDVKAYRHLMMTVPDGLVRVIYMFLSSLRKKDSTFSCPSKWLLERFSERLKGAYRYKSPYDRSSRIYRALTALTDSGVLRFSVSDDGGCLTGVFGETSNLPKLPDRMSVDGRRRNLPLFVGEDEAAAVAADDAADAGESLPPDIVAGESADSVTDPNARPTPSILHSSILLLNHTIKCNRTTLSEAMAKYQWTKTQILHLMLEVLHGLAMNSVVRPGGLLASLFAERSPSNYDVPPRDALEWIKSAPDWQELPWLKARRAAVAARRTAAAAAAAAANTTATSPSAAAAVRPTPTAPSSVRVAQSAPLDLVAAWQYTLHQVGGAEPPAADGKPTWFDTTKVVVLGLDGDGWLLIQVPDALYAYALSNRFGARLATTMAEAMGTTGTITGLRFLTGGMPGSKSADVALPPSAAAT